MGKVVFCLSREGDASPLQNVLDHRDEYGDNIPIKEFKMKKILVVVVGMLLVAGACSSAFAEDSALTTKKDKVSYALGMLVGKDFKGQNIDLDTNVFMKGFNDSFSGAKPALTDEEMQKTMTEFQTEMKTKFEADRKAQAEKNKKEGDEFLAANAKKEGVKTTASGLQYKVLKEGAGAPPKATDSVKVNYKGTLIDGTEFDSSYKRGEPVTFKANQVIPGWTEALQLMKPGSKYEIFVPSKLAYGENGAGRVIPPNATLIFEVELLEVNPLDAAKKTETPKKAPAKTKPDAKAPETKKPAASTGK
jgi:FKBP-type peptidyl-prolyl cis-trans isomerase FklB